MDWETFLNNVINWVTNVGIKIIVAIILLIVSFRIINMVAKRLTARSTKKGLDKTVSRTLIYAFRIGLKIVVAICLVGYVGIDTSGLAALITSLGVCIGLAVNGALSNLAGGIMIILTRPFKIDDYIEACGEGGTVEEIRITQTKLRTPDNKVVYIPNGTLSNSEIINYSEKPTRRVEHTFSVSYDTDFEKAKAIIAKLCEENELVLLDPAPFIKVCKHNNSSIDIVARVWVKSEDYWTVHFDLLEQVKTAFDENGIEIPFDQIEVNVKNK